MHCAVWTRSPALVWRRPLAIRRVFLSTRLHGLSRLGTVGTFLRPKRRTGAITKSGDIHARTLLIEAAHSYRFPARIGRAKLVAVDAVPEAVREIAWKAQTRLCRRYRQMLGKGKLKPVVVTAIARELAGFVWSIACVTSDPPPKPATTTASEEVCPTRLTGRSRAPRRQTPKADRRRARSREQTRAPSAG